MTFREKLKQDYPTLEDKADIVHDEFCPHVFGYEEMPSTCIIAPGDCKACWDREMPEEDEIRKTLKKSESSTTIKDSGARREFESGAVRDIQEGKGRCDLLPLDVVAEIMKDTTLVFISKFKDTGDYNYLMHALDDIAPDAFFYDTKADMILEVSVHFEDGAKKYGEYNWQKGIPVRCYIDSAVRHYLKFLRGDVDEPHDRAFVWNILCCIWTCIYKPELNEYKRGER